MSDAYWRYSNESRQPAPVPTLVGKRPRTEYDVPGGRELSGYYPREDERVAAPRVIRDTDSINASYDRYLRSGQMSSYSGGDSGRLGLSSHSIDEQRISSDPRLTGELRMANDRRMGSDPRMGNDPRMGGDPRMGSDPRMASVGGMDLPVKSRSSALGGGLEISLPPDASSTLFVEGLPSNCTKREVAHIFRPFVGYKEVRLVTKESRHSGGDPLVLCFVDFASPAHAATAMDALQGYKFDEHDRDSSILRMQFARYPGARSGGGHRGKR